MALGFQVEPHFCLNDPFCSCFAELPAISLQAAWGLRQRLQAWKLISRLFLGFRKSLDVILAASGLSHFPTHVHHFLLSTRSEVHFCQDCVTLNCLISCCGRAEAWQKAAASGRVRLQFERFCCRHRHE